MDYTLNKTAKIAVGVAILAVVGFGIHKSMDAAAKPAGEHTGAPKVPAYLQPAAGVTCAPLAQLNSKQTPVDLYGTAIKCANAGKLQEGADALVAGIAYLSYDKQRVTDTVAQSVEGALKMSVALQTTTEQRSGIDAAIRGMLASPEKLAAMCTSLKKLGPPAYEPTYMLEHRKVVESAKANKASAPTSTPAAVTAVEVNAADTWKASLTKFIGCKG